MINPPPQQQPINDRPIDQDLINSGGQVTIDPAWKAFFNDVFQGVLATQSSGTTAQRPTRNLYPGRPYFDTSLGANGKPIYRNKGNSGWVLADGTAA